MGSAGGLPDAWDDDWKPETGESCEAKDPGRKLTKAEKRVQHAEQQKRLWETAENPGRNIWLEAQGVVPLKQEYKQQVTLLSRKPPAIMKKEAADGTGDGEDSEDEARKKRESEFEERQRKAKAEREEKQKRYAAARERIMGSANPSPAPSSRDSSHTRDFRRQRSSKANGNRRSQPDSPAEPAQMSSNSQLFDPDDMGRRLAQRQEPISTLPKEDQPLRQPRGPDNSGGFRSRPVV